jgi:GGDEF domain-containing protein
MANKGFSLILIEFVEPASSEKKAELEKIEEKLEARFKEALRREGDLLFRSQHMFAILLNLTGKEGALRVKERLLAAVEETLACEDKKVEEIRLRIGLASYPEDGHGQDLLLEKAREDVQEYCFSSESLEGG